jgi:hypothetical protein
MFTITTWMGDYNRSVQRKYRESLEKQRAQAMLPGEMPS